jgi:hypothetical protein
LTRIRSQGQEDEEVLRSLMSRRQGAGGKVEEVSSRWVEEGIFEKLFISR